MINVQDRFENYRNLVGTDPFEHRRLILDCLNSAIESVLPSNLMKGRISIDPKEHLIIRGTKLVFPLKSYDKLVVVGTGKAGGSMAETLESLIPTEIEYSGAVSIPEGTASRFHCKKISLLEATHPIPSEKSVIATSKIMNLVEEATEKSLVLCLISGGGSSLMALPADGVTLEDKVQITRLLLKSGASIEKLNCVRKHLSAVKGGQLAKAANGARVLSLIISDIVGNPIESVASGPTVPDPSTFGDALAILEENHALAKAPFRVMKRLKEGLAGRIPETSKPKEKIFDKVTNLVIGDNSVACEVAIKKLKVKSKFRPYYLGSYWQGESRETAANLIGLFRTICEYSGPSYGFTVPTAFVWGGETTVTVNGNGKGGRNQEAALTALIKLKGERKITVAFMGTDGVDGFSSAAGAIVDSRVYNCARSRKLDPEKYLRKNDSNSFFRRAKDGLLITSPTGTNVNDIGIALVENP